MALLLRRTNLLNMTDRASSTNVNLLLFCCLLSVITGFLSCQKPDDPSDENPIVPPSDNTYIVPSNESKLVSNLNGFLFEGAYTTSEPVSYPFLWVQYADDYLDSTRVLVLNQNEFKSITTYMVGNHYNGKLSRKFNHASFPNNVSNSMSFAFDHPGFLINWYDKINGTITTIGTIFGINTQMSQIFTGMNDQYTYQFVRRFLIRYISGISLWPFNYGNWADELPFVVTSELSAPKAIAHYYDETFSTFPYDVKSNMYSAFFNSTNEATYIGIAHGDNNLDTIVLNHNNPDWYDAQTCNAFIDRDANTLYLAFMINVPNQVDIRTSLYKMEIGTNELQELYSDKQLTYQMAAFKKGCFFGTPASGGNIMKINQMGEPEQILLPQSLSSMTLLFGTEKLFVVAHKDDTEKRVEIYSKPY